MRIGSGIFREAATGIFAYDGEWNADRSLFG